jgi:hypothetical protein
MAICYLRLVVCCQARPQYPDADPQLCRRCGDTAPGPKPAFIPLSITIAQNGVFVTQDKGRKFPEPSYGHMPSTHRIAWDVMLAIALPLKCHGRDRAAARQRLWTNG